MRIKKGDTVQIISGKDRGKTGKVLRVSDTAQILIEGLNMYKKRARPKRQGEKGEMVTLPRPVHESKVLPYCGTCGKGARVGFRREKDGSSVRYCRRCKNVL